METDKCASDVVASSQMIHQTGGCIQDRLELLSVILFCLLRLRRYKAKRVKTRCYQEGVGQFESRFQGEEVVLGEYFLVSTKLDTFCYQTVQTALCYVLSF